MKKKTIVLLSGILLSLAAGGAFAQEPLGKMLSDMRANAAKLGGSNAQTEQAKSDFRAQVTQMLTQYPQARAQIMHMASQMPSEFMPDLVHAALSTLKSPTTNEVAGIVQQIASSHPQVADRIAQQAVNDKPAMFNEIIEAVVAVVPPSEQILVRSIYHNRQGTNPEPTPPQGHEQTLHEMPEPTPTGAGGYGTASPS